MTTKKSTSTSKTKTSKTTTSSRNPKGSKTTKAPQKKQHCAEPYHPAFGLILIAVAGIIFSFILVIAIINCDDRGESKTHKKAGTEIEKVEETAPDADAETAE